MLIHLTIPELRPLKLEKISSGLYGGSQVGGELSALQSIFSYNAIENN